MYMYIFTIRTYVKKELESHFFVVSFQKLYARVFLNALNFLSWIILVGLEMKNQFKQYFFPTCSSISKVV